MVRFVIILIALIDYIDKKVINHLQGKIWLSPDAKPQKTMFQIQQYAVILLQIPQVHIR